MNQKARPPKSKATSILDLSNRKQGIKKNGLWHYPFLDVHLEGIFVFVEFFNLLLHYLESNENIILELK